LESANELLKEIIALKAGGELRTQQDTAVREISEAITEKKNLLLSAPTGSGKALDITTPIMTINGWVAMGDLKAGDQVFDENGNPTTVLAVHAPFLSKKTYELTFSDSAKIIADSEHLWAISAEDTLNKGHAEKSGILSPLDFSELESFKESVAKFSNTLGVIVSPAELIELGLNESLIQKATKDLIPVFISSKSVENYDTIQLLENVYIVALQDFHAGNSAEIKLEVVTTKDLYDAFSKNESLTNHAIPVVSSALQFSYNDLPIAPYTLGAWIGNGNYSSATFLAEDFDLLDLIAREGYPTIPSTPISCPPEERYATGRLDLDSDISKFVTCEYLTNKLDENYLLQNKHIPDEYILSSEYQRKELLAGILDTIGHINNNGMYEMCLVNQNIIDGFKTLVASLGYKTNTIKSNIDDENEFSGQQWTVNFWSDENLFKLEQKRTVFETKKGLIEKSNILKNSLHYIKSIEEVPALMVRCISVDSKNHLFLAGESFVPTHNTLSYLVPVVFHGSRAVVSTATKQLSEQIIKVDVPFLEKAIAEVAPTKKFKATLLKGRENYYCHAKGDESAKLSSEANSLFGLMDMENTKTANKTTLKGAEMAKEISSIEKWADKTRTGDRSEAPAVSDQTWRQFSSNTSECPGRSVCPFGSVCFAERARDDAKDADVVVTNHAVVAHDLMNDGDSVFGERELFIFDELHEVDNYLTNAWGTKLSSAILKTTHGVFKQLGELKDSDVDEFEKLGKKFNPVTKTIAEGLIQTEQPILKELLNRLYSTSTRIAMQAGKVVNDKDENERKRKMASVVAKAAGNISDSAQLLMDDSISTVRWVSIQEEAVVLNAAPLRVGPQLQQALEARDATMVGTSATVTVSGSFDIPIHNLALDVSTTPYKTVDLDSPFNYKKQAMMYIPDQNSFPAPIGANRLEHGEAVKTEAADLIEALGGRTLSLHTTTFAANDNAKFLRKKFPKMNILLQGDAPPSQLIEQFKNDEKSVLVATMGMWHGLDVPGPSLSLVIMDKIPFKPMSDPLSLARQAWAEQTGRNGFMDVYVADANTMLAQGAGRLVRALTDKGVIAIFDTRLMSKPYGRSMLKSLPAAKIFQNKKLVIEALQRLRKVLETKPVK
jgi:ATP-dependent DNA helicase DinG